MTLTSKQRAFLRAQANGLQAIVHVGKGGITDTMVKQADDALEARELIKGKLLETAPLTAKQAGEALAEATDSATVQIVGRTFVLYRPAKEPTIVLPK